MTMPNSFFYDGQIRRFVTQFIRLVSNFYVEFGNESANTLAWQRVPVIYGDQSRQAAQIIRNNSASALPTVPAMAVYISALTYDRERVQDPTLTQSIQIRERQFDPVTGTYTSQQGDALTVERMMPVPYRLTLKLDIWTSNTEQKLQLVEQLSQLFNPAVEVQSTDNYIDWGSLSYALLTDTVWDSRSVPTSGEEPISIATLTFELPIWISTSAKVKRMGVIQNIVNNSEIVTNIADFGSANGLDMKLFTILSYNVLLNSANGSATLKLLKPQDTVSDNQFVTTELKYGGRHSWANLLEQYGTFRSGITQIRLLQTNGSEIVGTVAQHPTDPTLLIYNTFPDTLPANNLPPVTAIINPQSVNVSAYLTNLVTGTRYLLIESIGSFNNANGAVAWRGIDGQDLVAHAGDIVQYNGTHWTVAFDSATVNSVQYVTNLTTGIQYRWEHAQWVKSYDGVYDSRHWSVAI
jgi:hypothetical protein